MLKTNLFLLALLALVSTLKSQNVWLKGYIGVRAGPQFNLRGNLNPYDIFIDYPSSSSFLLMPAVAVENRKGNFWEIGATIRMNKNDDEYSPVQVPPNDSVQFVNLGETKLINLESCFEYNYQLYKQSARRWKTYLGWVINPYWSKYTFTPQQSYLFPMENYVAGADLGIIPRAQLELNSRLRLDMNVCFFLFSADYGHAYLGNPAFTDEQQNSGLFDIGVFEKFWLRIGLAWKISSKTVEN